LDDQTYDTFLTDGKTPLMNIGCGKDITIKDLSLLIKNIIRFEGDIVFDSTKPDGTPQKLMDVSYINKLGWKNSISLPDGIRSTYEWCLKSQIFVSDG
jgi:GDP-L-fucose synthase